MTQNEVVTAARRLIAALDRMHGRQVLSMNVVEARDELRFLVAQPPDPRDESRDA